MTIEELRKMCLFVKMSRCATSNEYREKKEARDKMMLALFFPLLAVAEAAEKSQRRCDRCYGTGTVAMIGNETGPCPVCGPLRTALREFDNAREGV